MNKYTEAYQELLQIYNTKLGLRDCHLLYDYLEIRDELAKEISHKFNLNFYDYLFIHLRYKAIERKDSK